MLQKLQTHHKSQLITHRQLQGITHACTHPPPPQKKLHTHTNTNQQVQKQTPKKANNIIYPPPPPAPQTAHKTKKVEWCNYPAIYIHCVLTVVLYSTLEQTRCYSCCMWFWMSDGSLSKCVFKYALKWCTYSAVWLLQGWCHMKLLLSQCIVCVHHTPMHQFTVSLHVRPHMEGP